MISDGLRVGSLLLSADGAGRKGGTNWVSPRLLLFFSCLLVMTAWGNAYGYSAARVGALVAAALAAGVALLRPAAVDDLDRLRRTERTVVVVLLLTGLMMTAAMLAPAFADLVSPLWFAIIAVYTILGLLGGAFIGPERALSEVGICVLSGGSRSHDGRSLAPHTGSVRRARISA